MSVQVIGGTSASRGSVAVHVVSIVTVPPDDDALFTVALAKKLARAPDTTAEDELITAYIRSARDKVERDAGVSLLTQSRAIYVDAVRGIFTLPPGSVPLQSVTAITYFDTANNQYTLDPATYIVDRAGGRIAMANGASWPTNIRAFQPFTIEVVCGWTERDLIPPLLVQATGLLIAHYMTLGRDLASVDTVAELPLGYSDAIHEFEPEILA